MKTKKYLPSFISLVLLAIFVIQFGCKKDEEEPKNKVPTCEILLPQNGEEIEKGINFTISVEAEDTDGEISEVLIYIDDIGKVSINNFPYTYLWNTSEEALGSHTIKAKAKDNDNSTIEDEVSVIIVEGNTPPTAVFTIDTISGTVFTIFSFDASACFDSEDSTKKLQVRWDWENDGNWDSDWTTTKTINHQYNVEGTYTVKMEVKDTEGLTDNTKKQINVINNTPPKAVFSINPDTGTINTDFSFDASGCYDNEDPSGDLMVHWDFENDGNWDTDWSTFKTVNYKYSSEGTFTVKMEVKDTKGLTDFTICNLIVNNGGNGCNGVISIIYEGQTYHTVEIGSQCWFKENLNVGTLINGSEEMTNNGKIEKYCYDDDEANCDTYGGLYQWDELMQYTTQEGAKGICPNGWHIPTNEEWYFLAEHLGGYLNAGYKLKSSSGWYNNGNGSDESGFSGLPGGYRHDDSNFRYYTYTGKFYTSTIVGNSNNIRFGRVLSYENNEANDDFINKGFGLSVRCIKDY